MLSIESVELKRRLEWFPGCSTGIVQFDCAERRKKSLGNTGFYYFNGVSWIYLAPTADSDNMGDHQMNRNLATNNYYLSKYGTNLGIQVMDSGVVRIVGDNKDAGYGPGVPAERFRFDAAGGFVAKSILGIGIIPATGSGERMMWHANKAAFRAGSIGSGGTQWDNDAVGYYTTAFGYNTTAAGLSSFATGYQSAAFGSYSQSLGYLCIGTGTGSVAMGYRCTADASYSVAIGQRASANGHTGALVFSDASTTDSTEATANNQFMARYAGGYRFYTNSTTTVGVAINASGNSWSSIYDSSKKENYEAASSEYFLDKLAGMKLGSWNYKGQDPAAYRHYGPMAQEIFAAYGKDNFGTIGCDTTLATADMDGIMMIMLQGLEKRSREALDKIAALQTTNTQLQSENLALQTENTFMKEQLAEMADLKVQMKQLMIAVKASVASK